MTRHLFSFRAVRPPGGRAARRGEGETAVCCRGPIAPHVSETGAANWARGIGAPPVVSGARQGPPPHRRGRSRRGEGHDASDIGNESAEGNPPTPAAPERCPCPTRNASRHIGTAWSAAD